MSIEDQVKNLLLEFKDDFTDEQKAIVLRVGVNVTALLALKVSGKDVDRDIKMAHSILADMGAQKALLANNILEKAYMQFITAITLALITRV